MKTIKRNPYGKRKGESKRRRPSLEGQLIMVAEQLADANVPMDEIKEGFIDVVREVHSELLTLAKDENDVYEDALEDAEKLLRLINYYLRSAEAEYEYNMEQEEELPPPISEEMMRSNPRRRRNPTSLKEDDFNSLLNKAAKMIKKANMERKSFGDDPLTVVVWSEADKEVLLAPDFGTPEFSVRVPDKRTASRLASILRMSFDVK